jgi:hypothetical protein
MCQISHMSVTKTDAADGRHGLWAPSELVGMDEKFRAAMSRASRSNEIAWLKRK